MTNPHDAAYHQFLAKILTQGEERPDRTGTGTISIFGHQMSFDLSAGFPAVTTKRLFWRGVVEELLWFLDGSTNARPLQEKNVHIWDEWAREGGDLGPIYGKQWRSWEGVDGRTHDQLKWVIDQILIKPDSRRLVVSAWNVGDLDKMALPPCHTLFQFYVRAGRYLDCQLYQRSGDAFLGIPFNIASYALLTHMVAHVTGLEAGRFIHTLGDAHIYKNHIAQVRQQLSRAPLFTPRLELTGPRDTVDGWTADQIGLLDYHPHAAIKAEVAV